MKYLAKLRAFQVGIVVTIVLLAYLASQAVKFVSNEYCHGSSHNARGAYCETVYANEDGYRALR